MDSFNSFSQTFISHLKRLTFWFNQDKTVKGYKNGKMLRMFIKLPYLRPCDEPCYIYTILIL